MPAKPFLMGSEVEYSVSVNGRDGQHTPTELVAVHFLHAIRATMPELSDSTGNGGSFLGNGARFYIDCNGHPEYCTPECVSPEQIAMHDRAGEEILVDLTDWIRHIRSVDVRVVKNNLTSVLPNTATFGNHESYTSWIELRQAARMLMGHLVTRLPYAGAGCLSADATSSGFELSQRARHLLRPMGAQTTSNRAIFCTRINKDYDHSSRGWTRAHLIAKDSHRSQYSNYLTFGTTGLLFWIANQGGTIGLNLAPREAVDALRSVSRDFWLQCPIPLVNGREMTALEIQFAYLEGCERYAARHDLPSWGPEVLRHWREMLEKLANRDIAFLATRLDTYAKWLILDREVRRSGYTWTQVRDALRLVDELHQDEQRRPVPPIDLMQCLVEEVPEWAMGVHREVYQLMRQRIQEGGHGTLDRVRFALRLRVLDFKYHELGGLYDELSSRGAMKSNFVGADEVERAKWEPPRESRAAKRGALVKRFHGQRGWSATWNLVQGGESHVQFDLSDPFAGEPEPIASDVSAEQTRQPILRLPEWEFLHRWLL